MRESGTKPYAQEADDLRLLFIAGLASVDDVVAWADRTILTLSEYDDDLVETTTPLDTGDGEEG